MVHEIFRQVRLKKQVGIQLNISPELPEDLVDHIQALTNPHLTCHIADR